MITWYDLNQIEDDSLFLSLWVEFNKIMTIGVRNMNTYDLGTLNYLCIKWYVNKTINKRFGPISCSYTYISILKVVNIDKIYKNCL